MLDYHLGHPPHIYSMPLLSSYYKSQINQTLSSDWSLFGPWFLAKPHCLPEPTSLGSQSSSTQDARQTWTEGVNIQVHQTLCGELVSYLHWVHYKWSDRTFFEHSSQQILLQCRALARGPQEICCSNNPCNPPHRGCFRNLCFFSTDGVKYFLVYIT